MVLVIDKVRLDLLGQHTVDRHIIVAHCVPLGILAYRNCTVRVSVSPPHPKIVEAKREVIKGANLILPETSSQSDLSRNQ
jgi:hypothetical protein